MEYKRLTDNEIKELTNGQIINFGNGKLATFLGLIEENGRTMVSALNNDYESCIWFMTVLRQGTIETQELIGKCEYCGALRPFEETEMRLIYKNRKNVNERFCKGAPCAGYYQMGCEG